MPELIELAPGWRTTREGFREILKTIYKASYTDAFWKIVLQAMTWVIKGIPNELTNQLFREIEDLLVKWEKKKVISPPGIITACANHIVNQVPSFLFYDPEMAHIILKLKEDIRRFKMDKDQELEEEAAQFAQDWEEKLKDILRKKKVE